MKTAILLCLATAAAAPASAQIFRHDSHRHHDRHHHRGHSHVSWHVGIRPSYYVYRHAPVTYVGYAPGYYRDYGYYPTYDTGYYSPAAAPSAAANGLVLGALAGGIIGHNSGEFRHNGWRGAAWGAGLGWLLGTIADSNRRPVAAAPAAITTAPAVTSSAPAAAPAAAPQQVTIINNYYGNATPMAGANALFGR